METAHYSDGVCSVDADVKNHPLVKFSFGADVHLLHEPSGVTLHLNSAFFGDDLNEEKLVSKLSNCYLGVGALIHFFETIQFMPGYGVGLGNEINWLPAKCTVTRDSIGELLRKSESWLHALLVADLLALPTLVRRLVSVCDDRFISIDQLRTCVENRRLHSPVALRGVIFSTWAFEQELDIVAAVLAPLVDDPSHGRDFYGSAMAIIGWRTGRLETRQWVQRDRATPSRSDHTGTLEWGHGHASVFGACLRNESLPSLVEVDVAYILPSETGVGGGGCPIRVDSEFIYGSAMVTLLSDIVNAPRSLKEVFGENLCNGCTVMIPETTKAGPVTTPTYVIGVVCKRTETSMIVKTYASQRVVDIGTSLFADLGRCFVSIRGGPLTGRRFAMTNMQKLGPEPSFAALFELAPLPVDDVLLSTANFVISCANENDSYGSTDVCKGFLVHDWVMYQKWPFFQRMIDAGMHEAKSGRLVLPCTFPTSLLRMLVSYIYTGVRTVDSPDQIDCANFLSNEGVYYGLDCDEFSLFADRWNCKALNAQIEGHDAGITAIGRDDDFSSSSSSSDLDQSWSSGSWSPPGIRRLCGSCRHHHHHH
jgi:hypothetical protein